MQSDTYSRNKTTKYAHKQNFCTELPVFMLCLLSMYFFSLLYLFQN